MFVVKIKIIEFPDELNWKFKVNSFPTARLTENRQGFIIKDSSLYIIHHTVTDLQQKTKAQ